MALVRVAGRMHTQYALNDRVTAAVSLAAIGTVVGTSKVVPDLGIIDGTMAAGWVLLYIAALLHMLWRPFNVVSHQYAMITGIVFWLGRGLGFLQLVLNDRWDLSGAVAERVLLAYLVGYLWHWRSIKQIGIVEGLRSGSE